MNKISYSIFRTYKTVLLCIGKKIQLNPDKFWAGRVRPSKSCPSWRTDLASSPALSWCDEAGSLINNTIGQPTTLLQSVTKEGEVLALIQLACYHLIGLLAFSQAASEPRQSKPAVKSNKGRARKKIEWTLLIAKRAATGVIYWIQAVSWRRSLNENGGEQTGVSTSFVSESERSL